MTEILEGRMTPVTDPAREATTRRAVRRTIVGCIIAATFHPAYLAGAFLGTTFLTIP